MTVDRDERPEPAAPLRVKGCGGTGGRWCSCVDCAPDDVREMRREAEEERWFSCATE